MTHEPDELIERGRRVVRLERDALDEVERRLGADFAKAVELIAASQGPRDRERRGQSRDHRAQDRGDAHVAPARRPRSCIRWKGCTATSASSAQPTS